MEETKNNAVEKVESVTQNIKDRQENGNAKKQRAHKKQRAKKSVANGEKTKVKNKARQEKMIKKQQKRESIEAQKIERERLRAEKRVELARIKNHKKAEKEKAKASAIRDKIRKKEQAEERKAHARLEKQARKDMLKNETKKDRARRKMNEKKQRAEAKQMRQREKAELKKQKFEAKKQRKLVRQNNKQKNKEQRRGLGGWLAAVISLGASTLVLSCILTYVFMVPGAGDMALETNYRKYFYDVVEQVDNIDLNLSKALATKDSSAIQLYLVDTAINSELCESDIQSLPLQNESKYYTGKLINQIGDYSKYLNKKLAEGKKLSSEDINGLRELYKANKSLKNALQQTLEKMPADYSFRTVLDGGNGNLVIKNFTEMENLSVEFPELIYDGPFSDGANRKQVKGLTGEEIDKATAEQIFTKIFNGYDIEEVSVLGESQGIMPSYNVQAMVSGTNIYAQISKVGGKLLMFEYAGSCNAENYSKEQAIAVATEFLNRLEIVNMKPVWINYSSGVYTINFAYEKEGVVIYPDMVKVRVCAETNMVIGIESTSYYQNHTERVIETPSLTKSSARQKVFDSIETETARLVVVPVGNTSEKLCYEFSGWYEGSLYYVYIDATNGKQVEMFKVIESTEGELLM